MLLGHEGSCILIVGQNEAHRGCRARRHPFGHNGVHSCLGRLAASVRCSYHGRRVHKCLWGNPALLPQEVKSDAGWSESQGLKIIPMTGRPYETGLIFGGETLEPRSGFRFIAGDPIDQRPYRYPVLWSLPPEVAAARPKWKRRFDELTMRWRGGPTFLAYGIVRSPAIIPQLPNPDGAANGSQPLRSQTNSTSGAAGSRR